MSDDKARKSLKVVAKRAKGQFPSGQERLGFFLYFFAGAFLLGIGLAAYDPAKPDVPYAYYGLSLAGLTTCALFAKLNRAGDFLVGLVALFVALALFSVVTPFLFLSEANALFVIVPGLLVLHGLCAIGPRSLPRPRQAAGTGDGSPSLMPPDGDASTLAS